MGAAYAYSLAATFAPGLFPASLRQHGGMIPVYYEAAAVVRMAIRENLVLAFVYNVIGVLVAAGALYPALGLLLSPVIAAAAMSLSSVSVIGNALRLRHIRI